MSFHSSLSQISSNLTVDAMKPLIDLLEGENLSGMEDAASAILNLCLVCENQYIHYQEILDHVLVHELLTILAVLSSKIRQWKY